MEQFFKNLTKEQIIILKEQISRFQKLKEKSREQIIPQEKVILPEGTLIHGTKMEEEPLKSISSSGIITGQYFGIEEDGETYYCADFHRVDKNITLEEYNQKFTHIDGRCPFGTRGKDTIAFIIHPNKNLEEIIKYDCYRENTKESIQTKSFVNTKGLPIDDKNKASSILFGIPSNFINGIIVGDNSITKEKIKIIRNLFPNCYLVRNNGQIIYRQNEKEEMTNLRIESIQQTIENEKSQKKIEELDSKITKIQTETEELWKAIAELPIEQIAKIYESLGWQGDHLKFAERLKDNNKGGKIK